MCLASVLCRDVSCETVSFNPWCWCVLQNTRHKTHLRSMCLRSSVLWHRSRSLLQKSPTKETYIRSSVLCLRSSVLCLYVSHTWRYGVATISRLLQIIGLFCKRALQKRPIFFKETYNFKEPTNRSHPIQDTCKTHPNTKYLQDTRHKTH